MGVVVGLLWIVWIWVLWANLGFVAVGLARFCGRWWFLVAVVVGSDMG